MLLKTKSGIALCLKGTTSAAIPPSVIKAFGSWGRERDTDVEEMIEDPSYSFAIWCMEKIVGDIKSKWR